MKGLLTPDSLAARLKGQMILAPLTRGGNLPFRRICADFGMEVAMGEMIFARMLLKGDRTEQARLRRAANEKLFCVQIATNDIEEGVSAAKLAADAGADWIDLNCGCPIYEATRRNLGSALLRHPDKLARLVRGIAAGSPLPLSVKVRIAAEGGDVNVREVVSKLRDAGAAAVTIHGRTATDRYSKAADWKVIAQVVEDGVLSAHEAIRPVVPVLGNGDILTHFEARERIELSGVHGVMVGRGALTKPWIFQEFAEGRAWEPTAAERVGVYRRLACYMKEHFGDDARGRKMAWYFLPWHFDFLCRYRALPESTFGEQSRQQPLMQTRFEELPDEAPPLERLLNARGPEQHEWLASTLWEADSDAAAVSKLTEFAESSEWRAAGAHDANAGLSGSARSIGAGAFDETEELANIPSEDAGGGEGGKKQRRLRPEKPLRSEEEIAALRAVRAAKREATGAAPHVEGARR